MKKSLKVILITVIICICSLSANCFGIRDVYAASKKNNNTTKTIDTPDQMMNAADSFIDEGKKNQSNTIDQKQVKKTNNLIYNILLAIGLVVAVIVGLILGIKFMSESADGKAQTKELIVPYIVGCIVIFGAFGIWKLVVTIIGGI